MKEYQCCNNPEFIKAYTPCKPFKAKYCINCGEVIGDTNLVIEWFFQNIFCFFWNGAVRLIVDKDTKVCPQCGNILKEYTKFYEDEKKGQMHGVVCTSCAFEKWD